MSIDRHLGCFGILGIVNNTVTNIGVYVSFLISVFSFMDIYPEVELLAYMVVLFLVFLKNPHTVFSSGCTNVHSCQQCTRVPFAPCSCCRLLLVFFLMIAILTGVK